MALTEYRYAHEGAGYDEYGIVELPARIVELKRLGHNITSEKGTSHNRFGTVHFNIYKLEDYDEQVHSNAD